MKVFADERAEIAESVASLYAVGRVTITRPNGTVTAALRRSNTSVRRDFVALRSDRASLSSESPLGRGDSHPKSKVRQ